MSQYEKIKTIVSKSLNGIVPLHMVERLSGTIANKLIEEGAVIPDEETCLQ